MSLLVKALPFMPSPIITLSLLKKKNLTLYVTVLTLIARHCIHELDYYKTAEKINVLLVCV